MSSEWMDDLLGGDPLYGESSLTEFYCPYTNGAECALISKGWQPQELCQALECEQMKFAQRLKKQRRKAA